MKGPPPQPTNLRVMRGNPARRPLPEGEPEPPEGSVECPETVQGRARVFWKQHEPYLLAMRLLTVADIAMLAILCETEAEYWDARDDVRKRGIEIERKRYGKNGQEFWISEANPSVKIASDAGKRLHRLKLEFGMSPSSRTRVKAAPKKEEKSALEKLRERSQG